MKIRKANLGDEIGIANVIVTTWKDAYKNIVSDEYLKNLSTDKYISIFKKNIAEKNETIFVLVDESGNIVGFSSGKKTDYPNFDCELVGIYIIPKYQKQGYGKSLFRSIVDNHLLNGYKRMVIWTFDRNKDKAFYTRLGGNPTEKKVLRIGDSDIPTIGFTWEDISRICF